MSIPGFTAEASAYRSKGCYRAVGNISVPDHGFGYRLAALPPPDVRRYKYQWPPDYGDTKPQKPPPRWLNPDLVQYLFHLYRLQIWNDSFYNDSDVCWEKRQDCSRECNESWSEKGILSKPQWDICRDCCSDAFWDCLHSNTGTWFPKLPSDCVNKGLASAP